MAKETFTSQYIWSIIFLHIITLEVVMARNPAVAGQFYPQDKVKLLKELKELVPRTADRVDAIGAVSPHAGYVYSGRIAGAVFARLRPKGTYVILSPNHTGYGDDFAVSVEPWNTPLGTVDVDKDLIAAILERTGLVTNDKLAHAFEHSAEVQVPFVQFTSPDAKIVPITMAHAPMDDIRSVSKAIADAIKACASDVTIIASSDMTHYESRRSASAKDKEAIESVLKLDAEGLLDIVRTKEISMCGCVPVAMMILAAKELGALKAELVTYADSGDVSGDTDQVVGYAGIVVY